MISLQHNPKDDLCFQECISQQLSERVGVFVVSWRHATAYHVILATHHDGAPFAPDALHSSIYRTLPGMRIQALQRGTSLRNLINCIAETGSQVEDNSGR